LVPRSLVILSDLLSIDIRVQPHELRLCTLNNPAYRRAYGNHLIGIEVVRVNELVLLNIPLSVSVSEQMPLPHALSGELLSGHLEITWGFICQRGTRTMSHHFIHEGKFVFNLRGRRDLLHGLLEKKCT
jgi:hypothetical protein